jgi:biotin-[acetyl-CoA-carboxylase] ligase BirA-like protein
MPGFQIEHLATVDSTNSRLQQMALAGACHRRCLVADVQTAGRGQRGRQWLAAPGAALLFSLAWQFHRGCALDGLSLAVGVMTLDALQSLGIADLRLKWPNDILAPAPVLAQESDDAPPTLGKLGGILIETVASGDGTRTAVIGVGLNLRSVPAATLSPGALQPVCLDDLISAKFERDALLKPCWCITTSVLPVSRRMASRHSAMHGGGRAPTVMPLTAKLPDGSSCRHVTDVTSRGAPVLASDWGCIHSSPGGIRTCCSFLISAIRD